MSALPLGVIKQHRLPEYVMQQNFAFFFQILQYSLLDHLKYQCNSALLDNICPLV